MSRCLALLACAVLFLGGSGSLAGPVKGGTVYQKEVSPDEPLEFSVTFRGGERACVILRGGQYKDAKKNEAVDIVLEVRDAAGRLVTRDDAGGDMCAVIWYPPTDAAYKIRVSLKGATMKNMCYVAVR